MNSIYLYNMTCRISLSSLFRCSLALGPLHTSNGDRHICEASTGVRLLSNHPRFSLLFLLHKPRGISEAGCSLDFKFSNMKSHAGLIQERGLNESAWPKIIGRKG
jgi:hypothetical protein